MKYPGKLTFPELYDYTVSRFGNRDALSFAGEEAKSYYQTRKEIASVTAFLEKNGISKGDRVAVLSTNMPNWAVAYFGITFMGAIAVPILPDFSSAEVSNVLEHSGAKAIFVSSALLPKISELDLAELRTVILTEDFSIIRGNSSTYDLSAVPENKYVVEEDDLASIIYTSGTTGKSKGVMLTHKNISFNAFKGREIQPINEEDRFLSVLPLSHTYENTLGLILPMISGACIYYLRKPPTPAVLLPALQIVRPTIMLTVPLIMEKIYFGKVLPSFTEKWYLNMMYKIPFIRRKLNMVAGKKLMKTFGGELKFYGIGGSKLNPAVENFLYEAKFPYAIGYGLTETSPLLAGANPQRSVPGSTGPAINDIELKINDPDPVTGEGEIWAKGPTVMKGYYMEPLLTAEVLTPDGWLKTGDLGVFDANKNLYIKGRLKNMILGASGENIYPEEIESVINNFRGVIESLVIQKKGQLVALVHFNMEELEKKYQHMKEDMTRSIDTKIEEIKSELKEYVNSQVSKFSRISKIIHQTDPFKKTATLKIKRFLYK